MQNWRWTEIGGTKQGAQTKQGVIRAGNAMEAFYLLRGRGINGVSIVPITDEEANELWRRERQQRAVDAAFAVIMSRLNRPRSKPQSERGGWVLAVAMITAVVLAIVFPGQAGLLIAAAIAALCVAYIVPE